MTVLRTPYSLSNQEFSDKAHKRARIDIYPNLFGVESNQIHYIELANAQERDYNQGIDKSLSVSVPGFHGNLGITTQERFRRIKFAPFQDITLTEFNRNSGMLGELYKIEADLMVYGYYNSITDSFVDAIGVWVPLLKANIAQGKLNHSTGLNPRSNQDFICFKFCELEKLNGVVAFRKKWMASA